MKYTGLLEKLLLIFELITSNVIYIIFIALIFITLLLMFRKKISKKICLIINFLATTSLIIYTIYANFKILSVTFDNIMNNIFTNIYFPSIGLYLSILIIINVVGITSLLKTKLNKAYKIVNAISLILTNFILVLILETISKSEIDLFEKASLFSNTSLVMLMEFTINIFIVWLISLFIINLTNIIVERRTITITNKELATTPAIIETNVKLDDIEDDYTSTGNKFIPAYLTETTITNSNSYKFIPEIPQIEEKRVEEPLTSTFDLSAFIPKNNTIDTITQTEEKSHEDIISLVSSVNNIITKEEDNSNIEKEIKQEKDERDSYTLNDYRIFNKMLKDIKEYNSGSVISIDKNLEYRLITKYSTENYDMFKKMLKIYLS